MQQLVRLLFLAAVVTPSARAQVTPERLYPLAVGDRWAYVIDQSHSVQTATYHDFRGILRREVVGDTLVAGERWALMQQTLEYLEGAPASTWGGAGFLPARFAARVTQGNVETAFCSGSGCASLWVSEPLPSSFGPSNVVIQGVSYAVDGAGGTLVEGNQPSPLTVETHEGFASDIGLISSSTWFHSSGGYNWYTTWALDYAEVGGHVYGLVATAVGPVPGAPDALALAAAPNPSRGAVMLRLSLPETGTVRVEAYDVTGRQVYSADLGAQPAGTNAVTLDVSSWAPGVYVVRVATEEGRVASVRLVRSSE